MNDFVFLIATNDVREHIIPIPISICGQYFIKGTKIIALLPEVLGISGCQLSINI
jgi:hypothetical protein